MIGATTGDKPDHIADEDLRSPEQLRGDMRDINAAKMSMVEKATVQGIATEMQIVKQQLEMTHEQLRRLIGMYQTLQNEFDQYKQQRLTELQSWVAGGSTTPEDCSGD